MDAKVRNSASAERELVIRRTFNAPRELVFRAWTEPQLLAQWSCPRGYSFTEQSGDLRVGGGFSATMRSPEGTEHRLRGVYREIVPPERLVFTHLWVDERGNPGPETLVTVTLAEHHGRGSALVSFRWYLRGPVRNHLGADSRRHARREGGRCRDVV